MKKLALGAVLGASLMISSSAFALTAMTDANMKSATGQAGVSIAIDNVLIEQYVGETRYTDESGTDGAAGTIVIGSKHTVKEFLALTSAVDFHKDFTEAMGLTYTPAAANTLIETDYVITAAVANTLIETDFVITPAVVDDPATAADETADAVVGDNPATNNGVAAVLGDNPATNNAVAEVTRSIATWRKASALSIDVGSCKVLAAGLNDNAANYTTTNAATVATQTAFINELMEEGFTMDEAMTLFGAKAMPGNQSVVGVVIGLPTLLIKTTADSYDVGVASATALNNGKKFINISKGAGAMAILGGTVEIAAH